ncbi:MAG: DUF2304 family protein [Methanobacteriaceae archaeon]|jgi:hypothetical protein|nr:DUF2304 family protein [Methanobacteriaceae archaeon]
MIYQVVGVFIGLIGIIISLIRFKEGKTSLGMLFLWMIIWLIIIIVSLLPESTSILANILNIGRGLDLALILGLIGCYYLIFKIYTMIESLENEMTKLVREMALQNEKKKKKEEKE